MQEIPYGYCHCGCGQRTKLAPRTNHTKGWIVGRPLKFVLGHSGKSGYKPHVTYEVDPETGCWIWQRYLNPGGYGVVCDDSGAQRPVHRVYYERLKGPIPDGLQLDHLCRNRACVNPDHLEPVTNAENCLRGTNTRYSAETIRAVREAVGTGVEISERFGVSQGYVRALRRGVGRQDAT